jgi:spore coat protein SA
VIKLKIAFICTEKLPVPPVSGGAVQLYINEILPYISKKHKITAFSIEHPSLSKDETINDIRYIRIPAKSSGRYVNGIKQYLLDESYELIHVFNRPRWVLSLSKVLPNTRFSLSLHNEMFAPSKISYAEAVECINRVDFINTVSIFIADGVKKLYPTAENKLNVVYSGVNLDDFAANWSPIGISNKMQLKKKYGIDNKKVVLHVSRISPKKGTHIVLHAMKKVAEAYPDSALVIVGSKWYGKNEEDEFTQYCKTISKEVNAPVIFTGFIPPSEIPPYFNMGDVFVCASQWNEPLARIHYEAMAAGLPIITTDRGGNAEIIEENINGLVLKDYSNPDSLADYINYLISNPDKAAELGKNARKGAEENFSWKRVADDVLASVTTDSKNILPEKNNHHKTDIEAKEDNFFLYDF